MANDWPDEDTPPPFVREPGMSQEAADLALAQNEITNLRLRLAAMTARYEELQTQYAKALRTIRALTLKGRP